MRTVGLIPARGGSKRLPRKNVADFQGKPIIAWTIEAALESGVFERVVVSTEDDEIAAIGAAAGARVHRRPTQLAGDAARLVEVCVDFLDSEEREGRGCDLLACLLATAPMRQAADIRAVRALIEPGVCEFAMAVTTYGLPPLQALRRQADGALQPMWPDFANVRTQDAPELVVDNGSTYFTLATALRRERTFYGPGLRGFAMPRERSIDIDESFDLELARWLAQRRAA